MPNYSPSPVSSVKLLARQKVAPAGISGGGGTPFVGTAFDIRDFAGVAFVATLLTTTLVNKAGITTLEIICADDSGMTVNVTQVKTTGVIASAGAGDFQALECLSEEIAQIKASNGYNSRYVAARVTLGSATDVVSMVAILDAAEAKYLGLTANVVTAPSTT